LCRVEPKAIGFTGIRACAIPVKPMAKGFTEYKDLLQFI